MIRLMILFYSLLLFSCKTRVVPNLFGKKDFHDSYGQKLTDAGLKNTALGTLWFAAAEKALNTPQTITIPYKETGYFAADKPRAVGLRFTAKRGQKITFRLDKNPSTGFTIYADLWSVNVQNGSSLITSIDTAKSTFDYEVDKDVTLLLRVQPELLKSGDYTISIATGPQLSFPVSGKVGHIESFWGDARDNGGRKHEGIDIFAPKGTPAVAAADGVVTSVTENRLGGLVVFMRPDGKDYSLYYAHLGKQLVTNGQTVRVGDTLGTIDNTGNAKTTPSHLHFGIYTYGGAIDPFPFVNPKIDQPAEVQVNHDVFTESYRLATTLKLQGKTYRANTLISPLSATAKGYWIALPDGNLAEVMKSELQKAGSIRSVSTKRASYVFEAPDSLSPKKFQLTAAAKVKVVGYFGEYAFVNTEDETKGWIPSSVIE